MRNSESVLVLMIGLCVILFTGEPDLMDAIIYYITQGNLND